MSEPFKKVKVFFSRAFRRVVGRTRLQKTVRILQSKGLPTNYSYMTFFYGPYSEGIQSEIGLLEGLDQVVTSRRLAERFAWTARLSW